MAESKASLTDAQRAAIRRDPAVDESAVAVASAESVKDNPDFPLDDEGAQA